MTKLPWPKIIDPDYVGRLLPALQQTVASVTPVTPHDDMHELNAPDLANALLLLLASVLEGAPAASTPLGMRKLAEAAEQELLLLMKDTRRFKAGDGRA